MNDSTKEQPKTTAMTTTALRQIKDVKELLFNENAKAQLQMVAAKHLQPERMMRVVANAIRATPKLQECEPMSFLGALMHCAAMGLEPNTPLGHAYLIPFENRRKNVTEVQVVIGYKGFIDLARRTGQLSVIHGDVVYSDDELWSHEYGSDQHIRHRPGPRKGKIVAFYCYVELRLGDGATAKGHRVMTYDEVIRHRNQYSQGWKTAVRFGKQKDSPWFEGNPAFEAMGIKTVIRAMANRGELPMSVEFMDALDSDEKRIDYRTFAMEPTALPEPEPDDENENQDAAGDVVEGTINKKTAEAPKEGKKAAGQGKPEQDQAQADAEPKEEQKPTALSKADQAEIAEQRQRLVTTILSDLVEAGQGNTKGVLDMYSDMLDRIALDDRDAMERINKRAHAVEAGEYQEGTE